MDTPTITTPQMERDLPTSLPLSARLAIDLLSEVAPAAMKAASLDDEEMALLKLVYFGEGGRKAAARKLGLLPYQLSRRLHRITSKVGVALRDLVASSEWTAPDPESETSLAGSLDVMAAAHAEEILRENGYEPTDEIVMAVTQAAWKLMTSTDKQVFDEMVVRRRARAVSTIRRLVKRPETFTESCYLSEVSDLAALCLAARGETS